MSKTFWIIVVVAVVGLVGLFVAFNEPSETVEVDDPQEITDEDHVRGSEDAAVTLVKYSDFQCPACADASTVVSDVLEEYEDDVRLVYRHFLVTNPRPTTEDASRAAVAAGQQDAFWDMHDLLFERDNEWSQEVDARDRFFEYAQELELDMEEFESDFELASTRVERDENIAAELGLASTPTFFINDEQVEEQFTELPRLVADELEGLENNDDDEEAEQDS